MGNQSAKLEADIFRQKLASYAQDDNQGKGDDVVSIWSLNILQVIIAFSDRTEQIRLIEIMFENMKAYGKELNTLFNGLIFDAKVDAYLIAPFNKKNCVLNQVEDATNGQFKLFFTNLILKGKPANIEYLIQNHKNIVLALMYYITVKKKDILKKDNENETLDIDKFVESYKEKKVKDMKFDLENVFTNDEDKLENIKFKNAYKFEKYTREPTEDENKSQREDVSWKVYNDTFLKYIITNQLNFIRDDKKLFDKEVNDNINLDILDVLCGITLINKSLTAYSISSQISKYKEFLGKMNTKKHIREKKINVSTEKICSTFLFGQLKDENNCDEYVVNVITIRNPTSEDHIKQKGKSVGMTIVDSVYNNWDPL